MPDYGQQAQEAAENRLELLWECLNIEDEGGEAPWPDDMTFPFDGCRTCEVRETLVAAAPFLRLDFIAEAERESEA